MKTAIENELTNYCNKFSNKIYCDENNDTDILMDIFCISPALKRENKQYWGRELGTLWEHIIQIVFKNAVPDLYKPAIKIKKDEPCDLIVGSYAIDTKYRVGSGDSGTLKKFKQYGPLLSSMGYKPVMLFLREDNLSNAINACKKGGWIIYTGEQTFNFVKEISGVDIKSLLLTYANKYSMH